MKDLEDLLHKTISDKAIGELMLARSALEEKHELIDRKDRIIRELMQKNRDIEADLKEVKAVLSDMEEMEKSNEVNSYNRGIEAVIGDILHILVRYEAVFNIKSESNEMKMLIEGIFNLLEKQYGLEIMDGAPAEIDPEIHQVIEVIAGKGKGREIIQLSKGYRIGKKILSPVKLKVIEKDIVE
ncbi:MAG: nucleotide exchange factor GrpE [Spirochaetes bacterium]|nr:nucleotide exchange factor GrpE [Spirochaetota bacterium]